MKKSKVLIWIVEIKICIPNAKQKKAYQIIVTKFIYIRSYIRLSDQKNTRFHPPIKKKLTIDN